VLFGVDWMLTVPFLTILGAYAATGLCERKA